jgi:hypothetical protein
LTVLMIVLVERHPGLGFKHVLVSLLHLTVDRGYKSIECR